MTVSTVVPATPETRRSAIQRGLENLVPIIAAAYAARDWEHFGFQSWAGYVSSFGQLRLPRLERREAVAELAAEGLSQRAIGEALGVTEATINRDLSGVTYVTPEAVTGLDGKTYPSKGAHVSHNSGEIEWFTPPAYINAAVEVMGSIDLDPASTPAANQVVGATRFFTETDDGLQHRWAGRVWMNPPYSSSLIGPFCRKLSQEFYDDNVVEACALVNNATETSWFQDLLEFASAICFPKGRIRFWYPNRQSFTPLQGQAVVYLGSNSDKFRAVFRSFGITATL